MLELNPVETGFLHRFPDRIITIDSHTLGEPTRLIVGGVGELPGRTIKEKRDHFESRYDSIRLMLTREPRGSRGILAAMVTPPVSPNAAFGLFYMDARRYLHLCGHATIGAVVSLVETGALDSEDGDTVIRIDTPSGPLDAHTRIRNGRAVSVGIDMAPSFVLDTGLPLEVDGFGTIPVDLVCAGGFFAMVSARSVGIELTPANRRQLISLGMAVIEAANRTFTVHHPERPEVKTVDVTEFYDENPVNGSGSGAVIYGESHMDRSPCGTGTTAKMTLMHRKGRLSVGDPYRNAGPLGTAFEGRIIKTVSVGQFEGIIARISGNAQITGFHQFVVDTEDPFPEGFLL